MDGKLDWSKLNVLQKAWIRRQTDEALDLHICDLAAQWKAAASIAAYRIDAGPPRPPKGRR